MEMATTTKDYLRQRPDSSFGVIGALGFLVLQVVIVAFVAAVSTADAQYSANQLPVTTGASPSGVSESTSNVLEPGDLINATRRP
jgi:hypothetical protein